MATSLVSLLARPRIPWGRGPIVMTSFHFHYRAPMSRDSHTGVRRSIYEWGGRQRELNIPSLTQSIPDYLTHKYFLCPRYGILETLKASSRVQWLKAWALLSEREVQA